MAQTAKYGDIEYTIPENRILVDHIIEAVRYLSDAQSFDGEHHKVWFMDQALRALLGSDEYYQFVRKYNEVYGDWDGDWEEGSAP